MNEDEIVKSIKEGFRERLITEYLKDTSMVAGYIELNALPPEKSADIKRIMQTAALNPEKLNGVEVV
jgi:hypothetical protein